MTIFSINSHLIYLCIASIVAFRLLLHLLEELKTTLDSKEHAAMVGIDLLKAFDGLPHNLLLSKLKAYGLSENTVKFLASY